MCLLERLVINSEWRERENEENSWSKRYLSGGWRIIASTTLEPVDGSSHASYVPAQAFAALYGLA